MSYSARVTGCTDSRLPFWTTFMASSPGVVLSVDKATVPGNRSTNAKSTMNQTGASGLLRASKYLWPGSHAKWSG